MAEKAKYWVGVCYPENMIDNWRDKLDDMGVSYAFCIHDKDHLSEYNKKKGKDVEEEERKTHVHIILAFNNTTTYNHALNTLMELSKPGKRCLNTMEIVRNIRNKYEYLIHNTEKAKKDKKYQYPIAERITGNNFDIGAYEQITSTDKNRMAKELCKLIRDNGICNFADFFDMVSEMDMEYFDIMKTYSGLFDRLCKGNYHKAQNGTNDNIFIKNNNENADET